MNKEKILEQLRESLNYDYIEAQSLTGKIQSEIINLRVSKYDEDDVSQINLFLQSAYKSMSFSEVKRDIKEAISILESLNVNSSYFNKDEYNAISNIVLMIENDLMEDLKDIRPYKDNPFQDEINELTIDFKNIFEKAKLLQEKMKKYK
jgi:hypothetical protein